MTTTTKTIASATTRSRAKAAGVAGAAKPAAAAVKAKPAAKPAAKVAAKPSVATPAVAKVVKPKAPARAKAAPAHADPSVGEAAAALVGAVGEAFSIRKKELVERVVSASGAKKKQVKDIVEHTLKVLGDALAKGEELNIPPFGKARVNRARADDKGNTMMVKVKQGGAGADARKAARKSAKQGIAAADD